MRKKITIFGAGNVGASLGQLVVFSGIADLAMIDIAEGIADPSATKGIVSARILEAQQIKADAQAALVKADAEKLAAQSAGVKTSGDDPEATERAATIKAMAEGGNEYAKRGAVGVKTI